MKEEMTSFDLATVSNEINKLVEGSHISKIYQIGMQTLLLKLRKPNQTKLQLLIEAGKRIHLTSYIHKTPKKPSAFCMSLRKYLNNGTVKGVEQLEFERIITVEIATRKGNFLLVCEFFGGGNIILVDPENNILQAMTYKRMRDRNIIRNEPFQYPPARGRNPKRLSLEEFAEIKKFEKTEIVRALTKFLSISGTYAEEALLRAGVDKKTICSSLTESEVEGIFNHLQGLLSSITYGKTEPRIVSNKEGTWIDATPLELKKHNHLTYEQFESFNSALDEYYTRIFEEHVTDDQSERVKKEVARNMRILQRQQKALESLKDTIAQNKRTGDVIYLHFGDLQSLLQKILEQKGSGKSWKEIVTQLQKSKKTRQTPDVYFHALEPKDQVLYVSIENTIFSLSLRHSIQDNANRYYQKSKKAEKKLKGAEKTMEETKLRIEETKNQLKTSKKNQQIPTKRRKREWFEKFRWFHSSDGFLVIGGRDATSNEILIKKRMNPNDIVFHAEIAGAPFVLIKTEGEIVPEKTISQAAQLAASYSRAWKEMLASVNVYWIHPDQISKTPPSGQSLKKGSFMIRGTKNFVRGVPLQIAIGIKTDGEKVMVIGGPSEAIANQTNLYVEIVQGTEKSSQLAKQIRHHLSTKVTEKLKGIVTAIPLEEFQQFIPLGRGKIK